MFRATSANFHRIPHKITCLPQNLRFTQPWQCDPPKARNMTGLKCCACRAKWRWKPPKCCACHENFNIFQLIFWKRCKKYCTCHTKQLLTLYETHLNVTKWRHLKPPKVTPFAKLAKARPYGPRTDGCGRLRTVAQRLANTASAPREWNRNHCYAFEEKWKDWAIWSSA